MGVVMNKKFFLTFTLCFILFYLSSYPLIARADDVKLDFVREEKILDPDDIDEELKPWPQPQPQQPIVTGGFTKCIVNRVQYSFLPNRLIVNDMTLLSEGSWDIMRVAGPCRTMIYAYNGNSYCITEQNQVHSTQNGAWVGNCF